MYTKTKKRKKNKNYQKGYRFERRVMKHFQKLGYYVRRNFASKGAEDLNAMKAAPLKGHNAKTLSEVLHIQCKNWKSEKPLTKREVDNLKALARVTGGTPLLAQNVNHKLVISEIE